MLGTLWKSIRTQIVMHDITGPGGATFDLQPMMRETVTERETPVYPPITRTQSRVIERHQYNHSFLSECV